MELFDTHAHFEGTAEETSAALSRAFAAGVTRVMAVGGSESLNDGARRAASAALAPGMPAVCMALGWDRDQAGRELPEPDLAGVAAVGEIGLDYHYSPETRREQMDLMARQLELASARSLPVVIHTRDADADTLGLLHEIPSKGVIHCFTGNPKFCRELLDLGFYISISGVEEVNRLAANGMPFRDAYKKVGLDIEAGTFKASHDIHHTHEGSIGNLCNDQIQALMQQTLDGFHFDRMTVAESKLLGR